MQLSLASLTLMIAAIGASAQTTISKPAPGFVQAGAGPTYSKDEPKFAVSLPSNTNKGSIEKVEEREAAEG